MPAIYHHPHIVREEEIDGQGHASNVVYIGWMSAAAMAHSTAQGWPPDAYRKFGCGWVVRSHEITYVQPAYAGEQIEVQTWVANMKKVTSLRRYRIVRNDGVLLAKASTQWAFIRYEDGALQRIPPKVSSAFELMTD